jgi:GTP pyrophosphokinase
MTNQEQYSEIEEQEIIKQEFQGLLDDYLSSSHRKKVEIIEKAFLFANQAHKGIRRRSGEPYIMHPLAVARIVAKEIGLGSTSICSALLHDVVEDTDYTVEDIENLFGKKIASIVDGLTKIAGGVFGEKASTQAENFRKLLLTMSEDIRVILIKMADRLHNMRTLESMPPQKQYKIAGETQYIYAPLAHRLGLFPIKTELENLSFLYEHPETYREIETKLESTEAERTALYNEFSLPIKEKLTSLGYQFDITDRVKSIYSIWNKMQTKNIPFEEVYDILALRIVFDRENQTIEEEREHCWLIYSAITSLYKPHPERIRDWVSTPKANGYEALHVTVMGPKGHWIEVQIRSRRMDEIAEKGFAAHWKYKIGQGESSEESELDKWLKTIKELLENPEPNAIDFLDTFKLNLFASEIFVFTPKGEIKTLPQASTALDFAFFLHSDLGIHCIGAKVNHKLVPLSYELKGGDQVEILTSKKQHPQPEWINFVTTARAKTKIKSIFKREYKTFIKKGERQVEEELQKVGIELNSENTEKILSELNCNDKDDFFYKVGKAKINIEEVKNIFKTKTQNRLVKYWKLQFLSSNKKTEEKSTKKIDPKKTIKLTENEVGTVYKIADCCNPIPGDDAIGFINDNETIIVHKRYCPVAMKLKANFGERIISAEWATHKVLSFPAIIEIKGIDGVGILLKILKVISDEHAVNVHKVDVETSDGIFGGKLHLYVHDVEDINNLCMNILKVNGVESVNRVDE